MTHCKICGDRPNLHDRLCVSKCRHNMSSLERVDREMEYECMGEIRVWIDDICQDCGKKLGSEIHVFKYSHTEEV